MVIIVLYVLIVFLALIFSLHVAGMELLTEFVVFDIVSAIGNNGLGAGFITSSSPIAIKWQFILLMWIGRLEILPVLILFLGIVRGFELRIPQ